MKSILFIVVLLAGSSVEAQSLKLPSAIALGTLAGDQVTTHIAISLGATEKNPVWRWSSPTTSQTAAMATGILGVWAWNKTVGKRKPKLAAAGLYVFAALEVYAVQHNIRTAQTMRH